MRKNGQRRYDKSALFRLAVVQRARETGFTWRKYASSSLDSRRGRVHRNAGTSSPSEKSRNSANRMKQLQVMEILLKGVKDCCCGALEECGEKFFDKDQGKKRSRFPKECWQGKPPLFERGARCGVEFCFLFGSAAHETRELTRKNRETFSVIRVIRGRKIQLSGKFRLS